MTVAKVMEITSDSEHGFEDAMRRGIARAAKSVDGIHGAWVKEQKLIVQGGLVTSYRVALKITFQLNH